MDGKKPKWGPIFMILAIITNPYIIEQLFSPDKNIVTPRFMIYILLFQLFIYLIGSISYIQNNQSSTTKPL